ncbi:ABC transporter substrate-binding protein [Stutzerimonas urumqiensis]|uniref:ABC transporter substrate-binding protein n=1 Tax=Stutzerimonas urumqiensis TaxID=638269 RepID=UPI000EADF81A|nr:ABC transporter substrate-binding protein [Stutzerimonas urumqiensis]
MNETPATTPADALAWNAGSDAAQFLYGMIHGAPLEIVSPPREMAVLMGLSRNGQGITLPTWSHQAGVTSTSALRRHVRQNGAPLALVVVGKGGVGMPCRYDGLAR